MHVHGNNDFVEVSKNLARYRSEKNFVRNLHINIIYPLRLKKNFFSII